MDGRDGMASGLETRKRLRLDTSSSEPSRKGAIAGVFKSDIFFKNDEEQYTGVEIDKQQAAALEQCLHSDSSLYAASETMERMQLFKAQGLRVLYIWESDWLATKKTGATLALRDALREV
jgi:hypothetical protein